jgi:hypothetical protein
VQISSLSANGCFRLCLLLLSSCFHADGKDVESGEKHTKNEKCYAVRGYRAESNLAADEKAGLRIIVMMTHAMISFSLSFSFLCYYYYLLFLSCFVFSSWCINMPVVENEF